VPEILAATGFLVYSAAPNYHIQYEPSDENYGQWKVTDTVNGTVRFYPKNPVYRNSYGAEMAAQEFASDVEESYGNELASRLMDPAYEPGVRE
jgi:hypothetical protein